MVDQLSAEEQVTEFVGRLEALLQGVLGNQEISYLDQVEGHYARGGRTSYTIRQNGDGIPLFCGGEHALNLSLMFDCSCRKDRSWLQIDKSLLMLSGQDEHVPIIRFDFLRRVSSQIPSAHINVYGTNDTATRLMLACSGGVRSKSRRKKYLDDGAFPTFSSLHIPVGGDRFRPGLEDLLQMAIYEFHIDVADSWQAVLTKSREEYRTNQLKSLIAEFPDVAYQALKEEGLVEGELPTRPGRDGESRLVKY
ncbi:hypothetical protein PT282_05930 [Bifidobacterium sp. ESL0763]|uniref:hypothetical protein n=1 Tax=Bifidobacterium sp. ESL0763 TaxID=2983227 RepID=UPI0023FA1493|nr:hypothetical protein [Bifidobacterium sp. ESL0763]MDF7664198.1 hypothetical protein [Bifidobacterium sp. ESL0763]